MTPALAAHGLHKRFGSLVVAHDIGFALPPGARHALIGPNGAGKTALINLLTGALRPDAGEIRLAGEPITALAPDLRVKRGLARTFQINTLFPELDPLEAVTLAVCERLGVAGNFWRPVPAFHAAVQEAHAILSSLGLGAVCHRPTRALAYGQQRLLELALALATGPKVLLLDEPAAGVPRGETGALFAAIEALAPDLAVLFIEHDMDIVFRFASRVLVMLGGRILVEGSPDEVAADPRVREVYLGGTRHPTQAVPRRPPPQLATPLAARPPPAMPDPLLELRELRAGYSESIVLDGVSLAVAEGGSLAVLGRNGVGKTTLLATIMGCTTLRAGAMLWRGHDLVSLPPYRRARLGIGWVAQEREIFAALTVEENLTVAARPGHQGDHAAARRPAQWTLPGVFALFPRLAERRRNMGTHLSGGEQQMLAIARALMTNPALLLLDEPLEGLAPIVVEELAGAIANMIAQAGTAIILVEQHAEVALSLTRDVVVLERGVVAHRGSSNALLRDRAALDRLVGLDLRAQSG